MPEKILDVANRNGEAEIVRHVGPRTTTGDADDLSPLIEKRSS